MELAARQVVEGVGGHPLQEPAELAACSFVEKVGRHSSQRPATQPVVERAQGHPFQSWWRWVLVLLCRVLEDNLSRADKAVCWTC